MESAKRDEMWDDELSLELPGHPALDEEEESYTPDDDSDLGLPLEQGEEVGLDADSAGLDEPLEAELELDDADEDDTFSDTEELGDELEDEVELESDAEDGWTADNDTPDQHDFDDEIIELDELGSADAGEEGFEDESAAAELGLPERLSGSEEDDPELDLPIDDLELETPLPALDGE